MVKAEPVGLRQDVLEVEGSRSRVSYSVIEGGGYVRVSYSAVLVSDGSAIRINGMESGEWEEAKGNLALNDGELLAVVGRAMVATLGRWPKKVRPGMIALYR